MATPTTYFTICSANYMPFARTLHASLTRHQPDARFVLFLADIVPDDLDANDLPFDVVEARTLGIETFPDMAFRYDIMEFNTAIKPFCFQKVFRDQPGSRAVYLDPDIYVTAPLTRLDEVFDEGAELILTPHALAPLDDGYDPDDRRIMQTGSYNLGFAAMAHATDTERLLGWWADHMRTRCLNALPMGIFVDQKFMDMAPAFVEQAHILRHRGYNVAYWNLHERPVARQGDQYTAGSDPLVFFHFSGVDRKNAEVFSRHQNRYTAADIGDARELLEEYKAALASHDEDHWRRVPYAYGTHKDGRPIADFMRKVYRRVHEDALSVDEDGLFTFNPTLYNHRSDTLLDHQGAEITRIMHEVWRMRTDLRTAFDLRRERDRKDFAAWYRKDGAAQHGLPPELIPGYEPPADTPDAEEPKGPTDLDVDPSLPEAVTLVGYLKTESGVGEAARNKEAALRSAGVQVHRRTLRAEGFANLEDGEEDSLEDARILYLHVNADRTLGTLGTLSEKERLGRYRIGYWAWELRTFPSHWVAAADGLHEIWVPSRFVRDAVAERIDKPITLIPHPVVINPGDRAKGRAAMGLDDPETLAVATVFDTRSFIKRKNPMGALEAFRRAFPDPKKSNVRLILKSHGPLDSDLARQVFAEAAGVPGVIVKHQVMTGQDMADFMEGIDVLLSPHRAEGFGLNIAEAMGRGKVAIATNWSGNTDFMTSTNSVPIDFSLRSLAPGDYPFAEGQMWAEPNIDQIVHALRDLAEDIALQQKLGQEAAVTIGEQFGLERIGSLSKARIDAILTATG
ncbi:glycosyltransferase [Parvularcula sp. ZS-1/3]|uniref:Glycosyltransferase n=1 Tax=Parvularcula mediterranea TaxID=2732508 RepID=A0A7Y3RMK0_9PROT|nr:glycosyltransferase [Parvularcula mediterranea]NNU16750.1 glycosyltransferase [Parvularcula mediterranea]